MTKKEIRAEITKLRKLLKVKPRGKAKGGAYEREVAAMIVYAFRKRGITKDDVHRTPRGSKEGDLKFGSALSVKFPFTTECKCYRSIPSKHLLRKVASMEKSWPWKTWWTQLEEEVKITKKPGILVFRENHGIDLISVFRKDIAQWRFEHTPRFVTFQDGFEIWTMDFKRFLKVLARS